LPLSRIEYRFLILSSIQQPATSIILKEGMIHAFLE